MKHLSESAFKECFERRKWEQVQKKNNLLREIYWTVVEMMVQVYGAGGKVNEGRLKWVTDIHVKLRYECQDSGPHTP